MGDFQTPPAFTDRICQFLAKRGYNPSVLLEPTVGVGNFIFSALKAFPKIRLIYAVDLQECHKLALLQQYRELQTHNPSIPPLEFYSDNIFTHKFSPDFLDQIKDPASDLLILGNPPWVTNAELSRLVSDNVPLKFNLKNAKGLDALTGKANFDIAESIVLRLLEQFVGSRCDIALLLKTSVIRNLIRDLPLFGSPVSGATAYTFDAKKEFGIAASAALFVASLGDHSEPVCKTLPFDGGSSNPPRRFGYFENYFVSDIETYTRVRDLDGSCPFNWRQGLKHDAAAVMLVKPVSSSMYVNGLGEEVTLEDDLLFPFAKGSEIANVAVLRDVPQRVIVPQTKLGDDTSTIANRSPNLWQYLLDHGPALDARKSSMYRGKPRFSVFGIGPYAFQPYKVGIASFYKAPHFCLIPPVGYKPVMLDDTSYFVGFDTLPPAFFTWVALNQPQVREFLQSIVFTDTKRPYTKDLLMRMGLSKVVSSMDYTSLQEIYAREFGASPDLSFTIADYQTYQRTVAIPTVLKRSR